MVLAADDFMIVLILFFFVPNYWLGSYHEFYGMRYYCWCSFFSTTTREMEPKFEGPTGCQ